VATKGGHYFWLSPDKSHVVDLTGDQFSYSPADPKLEGILQDEEDEPYTYGDHHREFRPGPVIYKHADHPLFKGWSLFPAREGDSGYGPRTSIEKRAKLFKQRADAALEGRLSKRADLIGADPYPGEDPSVVDRYYHDQPDIPGPEEYNFVYANGKLELDPYNDHDRIAERSGLVGADAGPSAVGSVSVIDGQRAEWKVSSNVSIGLLSNVLRAYSRQAGWQWGGITDLQGNKLAGTIYYAYEEEEDHLYVASTQEALEGRSNQGKLEFRGSTLSHGQSGSGDRRVASIIRDFAEDRGYRLAANDNELKRHEDLELENLYGDRPEYEPEPTDDVKPHNMTCRVCGQHFNNWASFVAHEHYPESESAIEEDNGHFPEMDMDKALKPHFHEREPFVFPLASTRYTSVSWGFAEDKCYGAHLNGELVGKAYVIEYGDHALIEDIDVVHRPDVIIPALVSKLQGHYGSLDSTRPLPGFVPGRIHHKWAAGKMPKDMVDDPIPFVYDVDKDAITVGQPGGHPNSVKGDFTPGGIVQGFYEPGGKVVITNQTDYPYTTRHLLDLWYWSYPHMEVTGVEFENMGDRQKIASKQFQVIDTVLDAADWAQGPTVRYAQNVGQYIKTLALTDPAVWNAYKALEKAGGEVYVVGGAVRDALMNKEPKDIDLMVRGLHPDQVGHILDNLPGKVDLTGKDFGVFRYRTKGAEVEIALPRTERSTGDRRVDFDVAVDHTLPVGSDLNRRDFTANAMAVSLDNGQLVDPYGGAQDIQNGTLRTVHPNSFVEDPTRLVRGLVAHAKHGLIPDESTRQQIREHASRIERESPDRIGTELTKLFQSPNPASAIRLAHETGVLKHLLPEVDAHWDFDQRNPHHTQRLGDHLVSVLENVQEASKDPDLRLAALLHDIGKPASYWADENGVGHYYKGPDGRGENHELVGAAMAENRLRHLRFSKARIQRIHDIISGHMFPAFSSPKGARKFLNNWGDHADDLLTLRHADMYGKGTDDYQNMKTQVDQMRDHVNQARQNVAPTNQNQLAINGADLIALGIPQGPMIGEIKNKLMEAVLDNPELNTPEALKGLAQGMMR
jgi:tRNA nucleotidyltransferase (CCA-adding enzyme)